MSGGDRLSYSLIALISGRLRNIKWCVTRIIARIEAGQHLSRAAPPPPASRPASADPGSRASCRTKFGWLLPLVPDAVGYRCQLQLLLGDPEMAALVAAAPALACRGAPLALPYAGPASAGHPGAAANTPQAAAGAAGAAGARAGAAETAAAEAPAWMPKRTRWTLTRIRGSPNRA